MGFKIKNSLTGEFEKLPILTLKGEKGETGGVEEYNKVDYMGNKYETLKQANDANVEYAVKTAIGEFNYLDYDGQHITATDTLEGQAKSAILSGNTLVNLVEHVSVEAGRYSGKENEYFIVEHDTIINYISFKLKCRYKLHTDKNYMLFINVKENTLTSVVRTTTPSLLQDKTLFDSGFVGVYKLKFSTSDSNSDFIWLRTNSGSSGKLVFSCMVLEYQEGMENWDIPYFIGMQSVKMPVLTTTGKNLFNMNNCYASPYNYRQNWGELEQLSPYEYKLTPNQTANDHGMSIGQNVSLKKGVAYTVSFEYGDNNVSRFNYFNAHYTDGDDSTIKSWSNGLPKTFTFTPTRDIDYVWFCMVWGTKEIVIVKNIQIEQGSQVSPFEAYKSNILTVNEDVTLRGIGDVKDELNVATGELTQRFTKIVVDGVNYKVVKAAANNDNTRRFDLNFTFEKFVGEGDWITLKKMNASVISDKAVCVYDSFRAHPNRTAIASYNGIPVLFIEDKTILTTEQANEWLSQNPITVQYELATPTIKTVDLSDNHVYSYKDVTHYDCSSAEGSLVPTLSVKVPTDVQATIAQQRETIQTLNSENERLNQIQEALKASMLDSQVQLMNLSWDTDFEVFTLRESIAPKDFLLASRTGSNIDKFSQAKFIIENDCPDLEKLNSQIEYYFSKDVFSQEQFEELTDLISIVKGGNGCEY